MNAKRKCCTIIGPCFFVTVLYFFVVILYRKIIPSPGIDNYSKTVGYINKPFSKDAKSILLWNAFFGSRNWYLPENNVGEKFFIESKCRVTNCFITTDVHTLEDESEFDAIVFHAAEAFPNLNPIPSKRSFNQLYVFVSKESPAHTKHDLSDEINLYNLTMSYRLDSDILWPYGYLEDIETGSIVAPNRQTSWRKVPENIELDEVLDTLLLRKNKTAAWFVSNCDVISKRDALVESLQKHIQIDIYGHCGTHTCPKDSKECDRKLDTEYKFYMSFENSLCTDYVTEKFFNMLARNIVPVVYGGADYKLFAPPYSFINVEDFDTVEDLANYLIYLDKHPNEYRKYFWWKKHYKTTRISQFCELCSRLNSPSEREKTQYYKDIQEWWYGYQCKLVPRIRF